MYKNRKATAPWKNGRRTGKFFPLLKKKIKMALKYMKRYSTSLRRDIQVKAMKRHPFPSDWHTSEHQIVRCVMGCWWDHTHWSVGGSLTI